MNILITGASSGIGQALAEHYAQQPNTTLILTGRDAVRLETVATTCRNFGAQVECTAVDVTHAQSMQSVIEQANEKHPLDLVVANAGVGLGGGNVASAESLDRAQSMFAINCQGVLNTAHPALLCFAKRGHGQLALVASVAGYVGLPSAPMYAATKNFVKAYGEGLRGALAPQNIKVNIICPGFVRSRITDQNEFSMPFFMEASKAAAKIARGLARNTACIAFPWPMVLGIWFFSVLPASLRIWLGACLPKKT